MKIFISFEYDELEIANEISNLIKENNLGEVELPTKHPNYDQNSPFAKLASLRNNLDAKDSANKQKNYSDKADTFEQIETSILNSDVLIVIYSSTYKHSRFADRELHTILTHAALNPEKKIIVFASDSVYRPADIEKYEVVFAHSNRNGALDHLRKVLSRELEFKGRQVKKKKELTEQEIQESKEEIRSKQLENISAAYRQGRLTLVTGAGISVDAQIPNWDSLLDDLLGKMADKHTAGKLNQGKTVEKELGEIKTKSSLIVGQYLKNSLQDDFLVELRNSLYKSVQETTDLIDSICELARPKRANEDLDSIITFNFDDLLEQNFKRKSIEHKSVYKEGTRAGRSEIPIYHVHGFLPSVGDIEEHMNVVFSEDAYHDQFIDPFSWSNLIQLSKYSQNTCIFVGLSLSDPNLRRLLDVSNRKEPEKENRHFIFQKRSKGNARNVLIETLQDQDASALGLGIIWIDEFNEITDFLMKLSKDSS